jgi:flagellar basal body-associated protein FliL
MIWPQGHSKSINNQSKRNIKEKHMSIETILIILVVVLLLGGGGFYFRGRR